jgi:hypothetical protein
MNIDLIERNLKIIKNLDKSLLYKHLYDNKIKLTLCFSLIIIVSFSILYYIYQKYFIQPMNYSSFLNLENMKTVTYKKDIKCAVLLTGNIYDISPLITQKYFIYNELKPDIYCYFNDINNDNNNNDNNNKLKNEIKQLLNPVQLIFDKNNISDYEKVIKLNDIIKNVEQTKNIENKNQFTNNSKYDIIIRIRGDLYVKEPIPNNVINDLYENRIYKKIYIPKMENSNYYSLEIGVNDYFSISRPESFDIYSQFYNYLSNEKQNIQCNIPEYLLKTYLTKNKVIINEFNYDIILYKLRTNQIGYIYTYIKQYIKKFNDKFHCTIE